MAFNDLNGVNIMKATRSVDFMKPLIGLIFFSIENHLILLLSCYVKYQIKIIMRKKKKKILNQWSTWEIQSNMNTSWKVAVFGAFLVRILSHSDQKNSRYERFSRRVSTPIIRNKKVFFCIISLDYGKNYGITMELKQVLHIQLV